MVQFLIDLCHGQSYAIVETLRWLWCAFLPFVFVWFKDS
jgi:hypothetical protein